LITIIIIERQGFQRPRRTPEENAMIVCHCLHLTDRDIRAGITPAVKGSGSNCCGSCQSAIEGILSPGPENKNPIGR